MKEFIEKLIGRLEEIKDQRKRLLQLTDRDFLRYSYELHFLEEIKEIVNELAEEYRNDKVCQTAIMYAENLYRYGIQVDSIWETATQQSMALNQAYLRGRQDERDKFSKWREEHDNVMINAQYCWQTCSAIEHCKECNRLCNGSIDYYENYDVLTEEYINTSSDTSSGWVACSERLPDDFMSMNYLTTVKGRFYSEINYYCIANHKWYSNERSTKEVNVIAWQPLPASYKEGE